MPAKPSPRSRRATSSRAQTNGALSATTTTATTNGGTTESAATTTTSNTTPSVASTIGRTTANQANAATINPTHQTHGVVMQHTGAITSASQLTSRNRSLNASSMSHYGTMEEYTRYLRGLSVAQLREHAALEAKLVPIDDNERLIKRLQTEWTSTQRIVPPANRTYTAEQIAAQDEIRRKLLGR